MRVLVSGMIVLVLCASCTFRKSETSKAKVEESAAAEETPDVRPSSSLKAAAKESEAEKTAEKESQKILYWFEQMDVIFREALWVLRQEKAPQGKTLFGKMQRALLSDRKQKLSNKSLFRCDVYSMTRNFVGAGGIPQSAEVFHKCNSRESFVKIGDWKHSHRDELHMEFRGGNLAEVLGFASGVLSPKISCRLKSTENGIIESFSCQGLMLDYNQAKNQVLRFSQFEYQKSAQNMLRIKAEVLESLDPVRKIEVNIPLEGKISVTETILQEPQYLAKPVPAPTPVVLKPAPQSPQSQQEPHPDAISTEDKYHDHNGQEIDRGEDPQARGIRQQIPQERNPEEGSVEGFSEGPAEFENASEIPTEGGFEDSPNEPPREHNTR